MLISAPFLVSVPLGLAALGAAAVTMRRWRSMTARLRRAEAELARLRPAFGALDHGVALFDRQGVLIEWNDRLAALLGAEPSRGTHLRSLLAGVGRAPADVAEAGSSFQAEQVLDSGDRVLEVRGRPGPDGGYVLSFTDISERRAQERRRGEFVSSVSHELRTPLTSITGAMGLMTGPLHDSLPPRVAELARLVDRNVKRLLTLVNDLLDADKLESGQLDFAFEPVDLNDVALEAAEVNRAYAAGRDVTMALGRQDYPVIVNADAARLQQVMANLISNAAKFSPAGGIVTITVEAFAREAVVTVQDHGGGVPEEFRARIFARFAQARSGDQSQTGGSGLGLAISRAIVERHGGSIGFTSDPGDTRFRFSLPLANVEARAA